MSIETFKRATPWFIKIPVKIILSRIPIGWRTWQRLKLFRAGAMDEPGYAFDIFKKHLQAAGFSTLQNRTVLELGPGNSQLTALYARSMGAAKTWLVDSEKLASENTAILARAEQMLSTMKLPAPGVGSMISMTAALERLNAVYLTEGVASLRTIPTGSVDFLFSNAVLEHVRLSDFPDVAGEMRRILKPNGVSSHVIDFRDHLQNGLNNLRFSERVWESKFMASSGFYTNRLTWPAMQKIFEQNGFSVELLASELWPDPLPTPQNKMAVPFKNLPREELMVMGAHVVLRPRADIGGSAKLR